jgi:hypothetical protein
MYPNYPYFAVAITRTCGSGGGSYIGKKLAKDFDIDPGSRGQRHQRKDLCRRR